MMWIRMAAFISIFGLALVACSSQSADSGDRGKVGTLAAISHVHGLGIDAIGTPYVATHTGLIKASGEGRWVYASADLNDHMGFSLHPHDAIMYRSGHSPARPSLGVESSRDGAAWTHLSDVAEPPVDFHVMAVSFADSKMLWGRDSGGSGTFRSDDGGRRWTRIEPQGIERQLYALAGPADANVVLAGTASGLYRSSDGGLTWQRVQGASEGWVIAIGTDPNDPTHMLVFSQEGMKRTTDGGVTWIDAGSGLPAGSEIHSLAISPRDAKTAYAADASNIYKTTDGAMTWTPVPTGN